MKFRSSKELRESMENLDKVINSNNVDAYSSMDITMTDAYDDDLTAKEHVAEVMDELTKEVKDMTPESPEETMKLKNEYTKALKLEEDLEDFVLSTGDGRSRKQAVRGEDEGDVYSDYNMFDFVSGLLCDKNCNTNPTPITPTVFRRDPKDGEFKYLPMKKFMTQGEDSVSYEGSNISGTFADEYEETDDINATDAEGMYKGTGSPQIGIEDDDFIVYSNSLEDLQQLQQGLAHYGIEYRDPRQKNTGHWRRYMKVITPVDDQGNILTLREWLRKNHRKVEDVMYPDFVRRYRKKVDKLERSDIIDDIFNKYVNDNSIPLRDVLNKIIDEVNSQTEPLDLKEISALKKRLKSSIPEEETREYIYDKYVDMAMNEEGTTSDLFDRMINELRDNFVKVDKKLLYHRFIDDVGEDFEE